jgi:exonuclease III
MSIKSFFVTGAKRPREEDGSAAAAKLRPPLSLCAWNANSLANRVSKDGKALAAFLDSEAPDVIFVSEVRMPAQGPPGCKKDDGKPRRRTELARGTAAQAREADELGSFLRSHGYRAYYSLSDSKYSGAALLVRRDVQQPVSLRFSLDLAAPSEAHHADGRVIVASFEAFELLGTCRHTRACARTASF